MKYIGTITDYFESKQFGFIRSKQYLEEGHDKDIFFHISDCSFTPSLAKPVIFDLEMHKDKVKAVRVKTITEEIDYLIKHWFEYKEYNRHIFCREFSFAFTGFRSVCRNKLIDIARKNTSFEDDELQKLFQSIVEKAAVEDVENAEKAIIIEAAYIEDCKSIVDGIVPNIVYDMCSGFDFSFSKTIPSYEELIVALDSYLRTEKPHIKHTSTIEDGHWHTSWKWDGSEEYWVGERVHSKYEVNNVFSLKSITVRLGYTGVDYSRNRSGDYYRDFLTNNQRIQAVFEAIRDKRSLCSCINEECNRQRENHIAGLIDAIHRQAKQPVIDALTNYLTSKFPIFGKNMLQWLDCHYFKNRWSVDIINPLDKYSGPFDRLSKLGLNTQTLEKNILTINRYVYSLISTIVDSLHKSSSTVKELSFYPVDCCEQDGMILSSDRTVIYAINNRDLTEIEIPKSVCSIGDGAFRECPNLKKIQFLGQITNIGNGVFDKYPKIISGDFSRLTSFGFNTSEFELEICNQSKPIMEWSYLFNKEEIDNTEIEINEIHIEHNY